jgi:uncharacterized membrane protein YkvA (DUF1232 family)
MTDAEFRNLPVLIAPKTPEEAESQSRLVETGFWQKLRRLAARLPFAEDLLAAWYASRDPATPRSVKLGLTAALAYFILPFDAVPDWIAALGYGDDLAVLMAATKLAAGSIKDAHHTAARAMLDKLRRG